MNMKDESRTETAKNQDFDVDIQSCSTTDCTGLIPAGPQSDDEVENYNQLYKFLLEHVSEPED